MERGTGTITTIKNGGNGGTILEDGSGANLEFINPSIPGVSIGEKFDFMRIIQSTPNGEKVINVLTVKVPN